MGLAVHCSRGVRMELLVSGGGTEVSLALALAWDSARKLDIPKFHRNIKDVRGLILEIDFGN